MDFGAVIAFAHPDFVDWPGEVHLGDPTVAHVGVKALGLRLQVHHHLGTVDALGVAWEVVHFGGFRELTARLHALVQNGFHVRACGVDGGGVSGGSRSNDQALDVFWLCTHGGKDTALIRPSKCILSPINSRRGRAGAKRSRRGRRAA